MTEVKIESTEIDLEPLEDDTTTNFSDNEKIPVEHINFELEQSSKLRAKTDIQRATAGLPVNPVLRAYLDQLHQRVNTYVPFSFSQ